ncbi:hypothetical protein DMC25_24815 [Caulobacter sp. D4A]|uniref:hypothetical protein n=1 Tax=unclassified Caulobacter TaxID=2648921 RepID=UPI000D72DA9B|nr:MULTISPECIES: hypothetical protein [unclassified Caulobacter]PXA75230.1 hypothetical protein DMC25_24815 [Caulobacter sp. D4A]PXA84518.1 hypothetical protein DMC18_23760 [Caulobacter sp. D5]
MRVSVPGVALSWALSSAFLGGVAVAGEAPVGPPGEVRALAGCWSGEGAVMGKPVTIALAVEPVAGDAMMLVEADSRAKADPADAYAAHLLFGGRTTKAGEPAAIVGLWADSFGGDGASMGTGAVAAGGFEVAYPYGASSFVNRWTVKGGKLSWSIVVRDAVGKEQTFASYELAKAACAKGG